MLSASSRCKWVSDVIICPNNCVKKHSVKKFAFKCQALSEKSASEDQTRQKSAKRRSLRSVNEYFEPIFNAVWSSAASFQTGPRKPSPYRQAPALTKTSFVAPTKPLPAGWLTTKRHEIPRRLACYFVHSCQ